MTTTTTRPFPATDRAAILALAETYWRFGSDRANAEERAIEAAEFHLRRGTGLSRDEFVRIARWKSKRPTRHYLKNTEAEVSRATLAAFQARTEAEAIGALTDLHGVGLRTATAILHWLRPKEFPILDFRVVGALGETEPKSWEDVAYYSRIAARVRELATKYGVSLRELDRALWAWKKRDACNAPRPRVSPHRR